MAGGSGYFGAPSSGSYFGTGSSGSLAPPSISPTQSIELQLAQAKAKMGGGGSILGDITGAPSKLFHGSASALGTALNYLSRPAEAVAGGLTAGAKAGDKWNLKTLHAFDKGFVSGLTGQTHHTFSDYIRARYPKFAANHKTATAIGGLAGGILTDPTLPLIIGSQAIPGVDVGVDEAEAAKMSSYIGRGATTDAKVENAQSAIKAIETAQKSLGDPSKFSVSKAFAQAQIEDATDEANGVQNIVHQTNLAALSAGSKVEQEQALRKAMQIQYSIPFSGGKSIPLSPTMIGGTRVAPLVPGLARLASAGIPALSPVAEGLGKAFKHGFGEESVAKPAMVAQVKAKELITDSLSRAAREQIGPIANKLSQKEMKDALDFGETRDGIVRASSQGRSLNKPLLAKAVRHGELTGTQAEFLTAWHGMMESMRKQEVAFGVKHAGSIGDKVYVPHRYLRDGGMVAKKAIKATFGLAKERQNMTLRNIENAVHVGDKVGARGLNIETDPMAILARRIQESGDASTNTALHGMLAKTAGAAAKVPDVEARKASLARIRALRAKQEGLHLITNQRGSRISIGRRAQVASQKALVSILAKHQPTIDEIDAKIADHAAQARKKSVLTPTYSKARAMTQAAFKKATTHFTPQDRVASVKLHGLMAESRRLEAKLARMGVPKGGPATQAKALAKEVEAFTASVNRLHGLSATDVEALTKDFSKEKIGYIAQPQGKMNLTPEEHTFTGNSLKPESRGESWRGNITTRLAAERRNLNSEYDKIASKYKTGKAFSHKKAIVRLTAQRERVMGRAAKDIEAANFKVKVQRTKEEEEWEKTFTKQAAAHSRYQTVIDKETAKLGNQFKKNPNIPQGWLLHEPKINGQRYYFEPEVHAAMNRVEKATNNPGVMQSVENTTRKLLQIWKLSVTSVNPGYRVRNTASDIWNMYIAGVPTPRILQYGHKAAALQRLALSGGEKLARNDAKALTDNEIRALRSINEMHLHGVLSGLFQGDVQKMSKLLQSTGKAREELQGINPIGIGKFYVKAMQDMNRHVENWGRITHYLYRRDYQGLSAQEAGDWVKKAHFDYEELTPFEQQKLKLLFPFYTWTRKDIPYQLAQMFSRPGKYVSFAKGIQTSNELATGNPHTPDAQAALMPSWMKQNYMFRVPGFGQNAYVNPNIGVQDLSDLEHPISQGIEQHLNPALQLGMALGTGVNPGTQQPIQGTHPRNPVSGIGADILKLIPGSNVGPTTRNVRGKTVSGVGANPLYTFFAQQTPISNFIVNQESNIKKKQRGGGELAPLGYLSGLSVYNRDLPEERTVAQINFANKMKSVVKGYRDEGKLAPAKQKKVSPFQAQLNALINKGG